MLDEPWRRRWKAPQRFQGHSIDAYHKSGGYRKPRKKGLRAAVSPGSRSYAHGEKDAEEFPVSGMQLQKDLDDEILHQGFSLRHKVARQRQEGDPGVKRRGRLLSHGPSPPSGDRQAAHVHLC